MGSLQMEMVPITTQVESCLYCCFDFHKEYEVICLNTVNGFQGMEELKDKQWDLIQVLLYLIFVGLIFIFTYFYFKCFLIVCF